MDLLVYLPANATKPVPLFSAQLHCEFQCRRTTPASSQVKFGTVTKSAYLRQKMDASAA